MNECSASANIHCNSQHQNASVSAFWPWFQDHTLSTLRLDSVLLSIPPFHSFAANGTDWQFHHLGVQEERHL